MPQRICLFLPDSDEFQCLVFSLKYVGILINLCMIKYLQSKSPKIHEFKWKVKHQSSQSNNMSLRWKAIIKHFDVWCGWPYILKLKEPFYILCIITFIQDTLLGVQSWKTHWIGKYFLTVFILDNSGCRGRSQYMNECTIGYQSDKCHNEIEQAPSPPCEIAQVND